jgi:four helix bundle protein
MEKADKIEAFRQRTKQLSLRVIKLFQALPKSDEARIIGRQLLRSSTSVAANYRASCRARSDAEFYSKISIVLEEADETLFWLEILSEAQIVNQEKLTLLLKEYQEVVKIVTTIRYKLKQK